MFEAVLWGGVAGSAVFLGAVSGMVFLFKRWILSAVMAFGTGALLGAATFELLGQSTVEGNIKIAAVSFICGAALFSFFDLLIARRGGHQRKRSTKNPQGSSGLAIFIGTVIDAIPESIIIGISVFAEQGVSWVLVIAIFISNFPEGVTVKYN